MTVWRLKRGGDRRYRQGHPWIFASELSHSAREIKPGQVIELRDAQNHFLGFGYGHPSSQIAFRRLSSRSQDHDVLSESFFIERLRFARQLRVSAGWADVSHRWAYAEADGLPGLIVDAFLTPNQGWLLVAQASTAGMDSAMPEILAALSKFAMEFGDITIIEAPSSKSRAMEGLKVLPKRVQVGSARDLENCTIVLRQGLTLQCDILNGQKTGFFLDQQWNATLLRSLVLSHFKNFERPVRILDLCCYVGQWAAHSAHALSGIGLTSEVTLFDASASALERATLNLKTLASSVKTVKGDVMTDLSRVTDQYFDVVICDPPAFVKKRNDLAQGLKAYTKLLREATLKVAPGGLMVASSCSGLVKQEDWQSVMLEATQKAGRTFKQLVRGGHAPDHPLRPEFPEGEYLKCVIGRIDYPF